MTFVVGKRRIQPAWKPPSKPDAHRILHEARADTVAKRYEDALAKHLWFHKNALQFEPSLFGVRLSFALHFWRELGRVYLPALKELRAVRDQLEKRLHGTTKDRRAFLDYEAFNRHLGDEALTREMFLWLDCHAPKLARQVYDLAERSLVKG